MAWRPLVALALLLLFVPSIAAAPADVSVTWNQRVPVAAGTVAEAPGCPTGTLEVLEGPVEVRMSEPEAVAGCVEARLPVTVPAGASTLRVDFDADRRIDAPPGLRVDVAQELRLLRDGKVVESVALWPPETAGQDAHGFTAMFPVAPGEVVLAWRLQDDGVGGLLGTGVAAASTVTDPILRIEGLPLAAQSVDAGQFLRAGTGGDEVVDVLAVEFAVPADADGAQVALRAPWSLAAVEGPAGSVPLSRLDARVEDGMLRVALPADAAPGAYSMQFQNAAPAPVPPGPLTLYPLVWLLFTLPLPAAALAAHGTARFWRAAEERHRRAGLRLWLQLGVLGAFYAGLLVVMALRTRDLATVPFSPTAWSLYGLLTLVFLALLATWQFGARGQLRSVQAHEAELSAANTELARSNQELARFAHVASHDLKEPLRSVQVNTQRLQRQLGEGLDDRSRRSIEHAVAGARRMRELVDGLLAFSSVGARGPPAEVDTARLVDDVVEGLEALVAETGGTVTRGDLPVVRGHANLMQQVFQNLVQNALRHADPARPPRVDVTAVADATGWVFAVADNGPGIPEEYHGRIFDVFQRLGGRTEEGGTGIGLAIVRKAVEAHGGKVWLASRAGTGSTFYVQLPREVGDADSLGG